MFINCNSIMSLLNFMYVIIKGSVLVFTFRGEVS